MLASRIVSKSAHSEGFIGLAARPLAIQRFVRLRLALIPIGALIALAFAVVEPTAWRRVVVGVVVGILMTVSYVEWRRFSRLGADAISFPLNLSFMLSGQLALVVATGGLLSPILPAMFILAFVASVLSDDVTRRRLLPWMHIIAFIALAFAHRYYGLVPVIFGDARELEVGIAPALAAIVYSGLAAGAVKLGNSVRSTLDELFTEALDERDRRLALHKEQTQVLYALTAEIAHELKNPLASVKGLGALIAKDMVGKSAERAAVMRREVDRMQTVLEELLNFSRPLVPLVMERVDASALVDDVARLHEGRCLESGVGLAVDADPATLVCDPRKVRQILVNLVQNGLDASPRGSTLDVSVRVEGEQVVVTVQDNGTGVDESVRDRLFMAGVTTKDGGSGIGLSVASSLARQHGGSLKLENVAGGGCVARLTLPTAPPTEALP